MNRLFAFLCLCVLSLLMGYHGYAQEEESAEVFLEDYTDEFQENFFEALKQMGIQNYDKAINLFLTCKQLDPENGVVDYQLAKASFLDKQYAQAQEYAVEALVSKPADFWYLETMVKILDKHGSPLEMVANRIPFQNPKLQQNLALIYFKKEKYKDALQVLEAMGDSKFAADLTLKIQDSLERKKKKTRPISNPRKTRVDDDPIAGYKLQIEELLTNADYVALEGVSQEALEAYPLQPFFHYAYGAALNGTSNEAKSITVLEGALDYLLDDDALANKIYSELSKAYKAIGNAPKANEYLNKIKPGL